MNDFPRKLKRLIALSLSSAMIALSAGPEAYAAVGRSVEVSGANGAVNAAAVTPVALSLPALTNAGQMLPGTSLNIPTFPQTAAALPQGASQLPALAPSAATGVAANASLTPAGKAFVETINDAAALHAATVGSEGKGNGAATTNAANGTAGESIDSAAKTLDAAPVSRIASASRISKAIRSIKSIFGSKTPETITAAAVVAQDAASGSGAGPQVQLTSNKSQAPPQAGNDKTVPPAPPKDSGNGGGNDDGGKGGKGSFFGLGKVAAAFIGALLVMQVGVEALGASMPTLVQKAFGDFTVVAQLGIFSSIASITGRQIGPILVKKYGLRKVYLISEVLRLVSISALCALLATGTMTLPLMMGMYSLNGLLGGVALTAESSIPPALIGTDQKKLERFWTVEQTLLEIIGVSGPIITGMVVASMGFLPALIAYPVSFAIAIAIMIKFLRIPQKVEAMRLADLQKAQAEGKTSIGGAFKEFFRKVGHGAKLVWGNASLKYPFLAYTAYMALNPFLYSMLAPAYALRLVGNPEHATSVSGWLTGLYSLGGLLGGLIMMWESKRLEKAQHSPEEEAASLRKSMLKWMMFGTVGLLAIGTLAFPSPLFLGALTLPALALIPFGIAQVITTIKLKSYFQAKAPQAEMADAMGFFGAASLAVSTIGLLILKYAFKHALGFTPFYWIAGAMIPMAMLYIFLTRKMAKVSAPEEKK
jgi:MFS family permease